MRKSVMNLVVLMNEYIEAQTAMDNYFGSLELNGIEIDTNDELYNDLWANATHAKQRLDKEFIEFINRTYKSNVEVDLTTYINKTYYNDKGEI